MTNKDITQIFFVLNFKKFKTLFTKVFIDWKNIKIFSALSGDAGVHFENQNEV